MLQMDGLLLFKSLLTNMSVTVETAPYGASANFDGRPAAGTASQLDFHESWFEELPDRQTLVIEVARGVWRGRVGRQRSWIYAETPNDLVHALFQRTRKRWDKVMDKVDAKR